MYFKSKMFFKKEKNAKLSNRSLNLINIIPQKRLFKGRYPKTKTNFKF